MDCTNCRSENPSGFRHCGACGHRLPATPCDSCGFSTPAPFVYCGNCGLHLDANPDASPEERRFATVVFADVVGYTKLADASDPEDMARIVDTAFRQLSEIVYSHGGTIDKYIGDSLMAVFGIPQAHEDDAERAVAAALAMQRADTGLGFSIGVNTGEVMVTALGGGAVTAMGDTVNVAARLEKAANGGEVLVGPITHALTVGRVNYRERPPMTLKGKREPVEVFNAISLRAQSALTDTPSVPMIGRVEELDFLHSQLKRAVAVKRLAIVLLTGEAGIGKTRLLDELVERIGDDALVVRSSYPPYGGAGGVRVGGDLLAQLGPSSDESVQRRVRSLTGDTDPSLRGIDPSALRKEQVWALRRLAEDRAKERPLLVIIEDVHMASTSIDLLTTFAAQLVDLPMMLILAGRPDGPWLTSFPMASNVRLRSLGLDGSRRLARQWLTPGSAAEPTDDLLAWAGGNPLFLRELLSFTERHPDAAIDRQQLPVSLRGVLAARLDMLAPAERNVLQDFAVIGDNATVEQLTALGGTPALEGISALTNAGVIRHRPDGTLRVTEPLLREVAYESMPRAVRSERHMRMAELSVGQPNGLDDRARHLSRASEHASEDLALRSAAGDALSAAGLAALEQSRRPEGIASLQKAVAMGHADPHCLLQLARALIDTDRQETLRLLTAFPEPSGDDATDAERVLIRANALAEFDPETAFAAFDDAAKRFGVLGDRSHEGWAHSNKGVALFMRGRSSDSDAELVRALELFRSAGDREGEYATVSFRSLVRPEHPDVDLWLTQSLAYAVEIGDRSRHLAALTSLVWHHYLASRLGGPRETAAARSWIDEQVALASQLGATDATLQGLCLRANLLRSSGDFTSARLTMDEARELRKSESEGERALFAAVEASLDPGRPFRSFPGSDPFSVLATVVQVENALAENRFADLLEAGLVRSSWTNDQRQLAVGIVPTAAGFLIAEQLETAADLAAKVLALPENASTRLPRIGAQAIQAECAVRSGAAFALDPRPGDYDGFVGALIDRAWAWSGDADALIALDTHANQVRAVGLATDVVLSANSS